MVSMSVSGSPTCLKGALFSMQCLHPLRCAASAVTVGRCSGRRQLLYKVVLRCLIRTDSCRLAVPSSQGPGVGLMTPTGYLKG